jgi:Bacterial antitoxin of type II TA system, VapB
MHDCRRCVASGSETSGVHGLPADAKAPNQASLGATFCAVSWSSPHAHDLLAKATKLTGPMDRSAMVREGLKALIERESAKRLARLGGSQPALKAAPRRRQGTAA